MHEVFPDWLRKSMRFLGLISVVFAVVIPFRYFVAQPFIVSGASMVPTLNPREYLIIDRLSERSQKPQRGDVIVFKYPLDPSTYFIKRVIGLPGEQVRIEGGEVRVASTTGEMTLIEPYLSSGMNEESMILLAPDEYFMLGDNRAASSDSRVWGPVKERYLLGRPILRLFPFSRIEMWPGTASKVQ